MISVIGEVAWLYQPLNRTSENEIAIILFFMVAITAFLFIGFLTIVEIFSMMKKEFEDIKKRQKEAKEYKADSLSKSD